MAVPQRAPGRMCVSSSRCCSCRAPRCAMASPRCCCCCCRRDRSPVVAAQEFCFIARPRRPLTATPRCCSGHCRLRSSSPRPRSHPAPRPAAVAPGAALASPWLYPYSPRHPLAPGPPRSSTAAALLEPDHGLRSLTLPPTAADAALSPRPAAPAPAGHSRRPRTPRPSPASGTGDLARPFAHARSGGFARPFDAPAPGGL
nr:translation initiation factor IF-2-like [Aegilops tauschii subsp. strangulata]